ncbi:MAG: acetylornithine deacetylase/succinyl-diaminopimelate desuccinylase family protein [Gemmatimonadetes bacterium]|nr:acetylornithine deacetylase/succinyl-diaminopimelate desuccinylase family protein [Gemmatimonadota bacterium]
MLREDTVDRLLVEVEQAREELVDFVTELVRIPTVNPPGEAYQECAQVIGDRLSDWGMEVEYVEPVGRPENTVAYPRVNVIGRSAGEEARPLLHLNGHFDVVPPGEGWTLDPFEGIVRNGRIYGRGASDMKSGLGAAAFALECLRRTGIKLRGSIELSATVDEESGGMAGVASLCSTGHISSARTDYVIIPEPFGPDRICVGHKGVYWFDIVAQGRVAHGSMPPLGRSAIDDMAALVDSVRTQLKPRLSLRQSKVPVVPPESATASINVNAISGGQPEGLVQTPCVADLAVATFDRRFLAEETLGDVRAEVAELVSALEAEDPGRRYTIKDRLIVEPVSAPDDSPVVRALANAIQRVRGRSPELVVSPGTYDQKHVARIAGLEHCVAYGPGPLEEAHQADESCAIDDLVTAAQTLAVAALELVG